MARTPEELPIQRARDEIRNAVRNANRLVVVAPTGSGKSTLLRLLNRQDRPERGAVWVAGRNIVDMPPSQIPHLRRNIGNIFQDYKLLLEKNVFENVAFAQEVIGRPQHVIRQQVPAVLDLVGLAGKEERLPNQLSGGEQQRVSIARAFVNRPLILLADEPTGNLDSKSGAEIMQIVEQLNRDGIGLLIVTHDPLIGRRARRHLTLHDGKIVSDETNA